MASDEMVDEDDVGGYADADDDTADAEENSLSARMSALAADAQRLGLTLPTAFVSFMTNLALHERIPSCTACEFALPQRIVPSLGGDGGYLISFLHDQQGLAVVSLSHPSGGAARASLTGYHPTITTAPAMIHLASMR